MTYNVNLPLSTDPIRQFPGDVTTNNWPRLRTIVDGDHQFNNSVASTDGYHKVIHFVDQATTDPATVAGVGQFYTKTVTVVDPANVDQQLFFKTGGGVVKQITGVSSAAGNGYTTLPNGLLLQWGQATLGANPTVILFPIDFVSAVYSINVTAFRDDDDNDSVYIRSTGTITLSQFEVMRSTLDITRVSWMAIGV